MRETTIIRITKARHIMFDSRNSIPRLISQIQLRKYL